MFTELKFPSDRPITRKSKSLLLSNFIAERTFLRFFLGFFPPIAKK